MQLDIVVAVERLGILNRDGLFIQVFFGAPIGQHDVSHQIGDRIALACGTQVWPHEPVRLDYAPATRDASLSDVAEAAGTSLWTVLRHRAGAERRGSCAGSR